MSKKLHYVSLRALHHLMQGLSFDVGRCAEVLDDALVQLNAQTQIPDKIVRWNKVGGNARRPLNFPEYGRIIVDISETFSPGRGKLQLAQVVAKKDEKETAPVAFFSMHSPTLDIPMRAEVPLRAVLKGGRDPSGTYIVYLHALLADDGTEFVYYGITKRGWNLRFAEHTKAALAEGSHRLFPRKLAELVEARAAERTGRNDPRPKLAGMVSAVCASGIDEEMALDVEEYLVDKYSLAAKHPLGLNMIPGGREGIRALHQLSGQAREKLIETESREDALDAHLVKHPQIGIPKPGVAQAWNDPAYAEAVICGRDNRLRAEQVREIRYLAAMGWDVAAIREEVDAIDEGQIRRVLVGRTYARIK